MAAAVCPGELAPAPRVFPRLIHRMVVVPRVLSTGLLPRVLLIWRLRALFPASYPQD